jgi:hypothetical protein
MSMFGFRSRPASCIRGAPAPAGGGASPGSPGPPACAARIHPSQTVFGAEIAGPEAHVPGDDGQHHEHDPQRGERGPG